MTNIANENARVVGGLLQARRLSDVLRDRLLRGGVGSMAVGIGHALLAFATTVVLARVLGAEALGAYAFAYALLNLLMVPSQFGIPQLVVRETAKAEAVSDWGRMRGLWRWSTMTVFLFSLAVFTAIAVWLAFFSDSESDQRVRTVLVGLALIPFVALGNLRGASLRGLRRVVIGQLPENILRPALFTLLVLTMWYLTPWWGLGPERVMGLHVLAAMVSFVVGALMLWRVKPAQLRSDPPATYDSRAWMAAAVPFAFINGFQLAGKQIDILLLGLLRDGAEVGIYRVVVQMSILIPFGLHAINTVVAPHFARLHALGDKGKIQKLATNSARGALLTALPVSIGFIFLGEWFLGIVFGAEYRLGYVPLLLFVFAHAVNAAVGSVGMLLTMAGHERTTLHVTIATIAANVVLHLLLIPRFGIYGAATATAAAIVLRNLVLWNLVRTRLGVRSDAFGKPSGHSPARVDGR